MALVSASPAVAPTLDDARCAAAVLAEHGAAQVLVFGSVARGEASAYSDIDLVAVFDDLGDYSCRYSLRATLTECARDAAGAAVDLWVTDRPEWRRRTTVVTSSFEAAIADYAFTLADRPPAGLINWDKEIGMPPDNRAEALERLKDTDNALSRVFNGLHEGAKELVEAGSGDVRRWANARYERMAFVCTDAQTTIESAYKTAACLAGENIVKIHSLHHLAAAVPAEYGDIVEPATSPHNSVTPSTITLWHTAGPYVGERLALTLDEIEDIAIELARIASRTAAALAGHFDGASDARTAAGDLAHTAAQVEAGLLVADIGKETRRSVGRPPVRRVGAPTSGCNSGRRALLPSRHRGLAFAFSDKFHR